MTARAITEALLGGRWHGSYGTACCPCHEDHEPSLSISDGQDGRLLIHCFAGCDPVDILRALNGQGLSEPPGGSPAPRLHYRDNGRAALDIWRESLPAAGTLVEKYLRRRGITLPVPPSIRFHPGLRHKATGLILPVMVAAVQAPDRRVTAIHRTYLNEFGGKATLSAPKMALGPLGAGAVRLAKAGRVLGLAEGIEDGLAAMQLCDLPCWASLGGARLARVDLPGEVREVQIFADGDDAGREAAESVSRPRPTFSRPGKHGPTEQASTSERAKPSGKDWKNAAWTRTAETAGAAFSGSASSARTTTTIRATEDR